MREMISWPSDALVAGFGCSRCGWLFHIQKPLTPETPIEFQRRIAQRWYGEHACEAFLLGADAPRKREREVHASLRSYRA